MQINAQTLETVGRFFDTSKAPVTDRAIIYVIDDIHYRIDEDGCWFFSDDPHDMGWTRCKAPAVLQSLM